MSNQKTVTLELYAPDGTKVRLTEYVSSPGDLAALLAFSRDAGLSPREPEHPDVYEQAWVSHVALRVHRNDDGSETPHVGLYHSNPGMESKWLGLYLNTPQQVAEFEDAVGVRLTDIPVTDDDKHPQRKAGKAARGIVALPGVVKIERYTQTWGEADTDKRHRLSRYITRAKGQNGH